MNERVRACWVHLMVSVAVLLVLAAIVYGIWYPGPYWKIQAVTGMVGLLSATVLVLGPPLTLLVYRPRKKHLALDLAVIVLLQLAALSYGAWVIFSERPYFMVFAVDRFNVLAARDVDFDEIRKPDHALKPLRGPRLIVASLPEEPEKFQKFQRSVLFEGKPDLERRPEFWSLYEERKEEALTKARRLVALVKRRPDKEEVFARVAKKSGNAAVDLRYVPVVGRKRDFAVVLDPDNGDIVDAIAVDPWFD